MKNKSISKLLTLALVANLSMTIQPISWAAEVTNVYADVNGITAVVNEEVNAEDCSLTMNGTPVDGEFIITEGKLDFKPAQKLDTDVVYTLKIASESWLEAFLNKYPSILTNYNNV